ncbi:MAG: endo-1,4-beta-xylanase [Firmicutes bacterium]|nr:endo-1,4-beta-xylanase [Bacillota bacterium]
MGRRINVNQGLILLLAALLVFGAPAAMAQAGQAMPAIDFEDGTPQGFAGRGGAEVLEVSGDRAHSGGYSLKTSGRQQGWNGPSLNVTEYITEGLEYQMTVWVHADTPDSSNFKLSTQIGQGDAASYVNVAAKVIRVSDGWVQMSGKHRYANTPSGYVTVYVENDDPAASFYIDDLEVVEVSGGGVRFDAALLGLKDKYEGKFLIGNVISPADTRGVRFDMLGHHFNVLTAENAMKPENMQPAKGNFTFGAADAMLETALAAGFKIHGHTLAWHQQSPAWLNQDDSGNPLPRAEAEQNLTGHVQGVAGHYRGKLLSWDVLNEAMSDNPSTPDDWRASLRVTPWYEAFANGALEGQSGADYINLLFREARKADPDALLYYNDYNLDNQNKATAVANMVKELNDAYIAEGNTRPLIDGIGMQGHYSVDTDMESVENSMKRFIDLGVEISLTELDITVPGADASKGLTEDAEMRQACKYAELFVLCKKYADHIARVTFWGLDDGSSWRASQFPLLFNADLSAKQAYTALMDPERYLIRNKPKNPALTGMAMRGTPVIDGVIDDVWEAAEALPIARMLQAWETASGCAKVLWDDDNLYVLFEVHDTVLDASSSTVHEQDSVEAFLDESNCKQGGYETAEDGQYRVSYENSQSFGSQGKIEGFASAVTVNGTNYTVEMKIPFRLVKPEAGMIIGFEAQINDGEGGGRVGIAKWCDATDNSWQNTKGWGTVTLHTVSR